MKTFKQHILEKLKIDTSKNSDPRDYETVDMLSSNASDKRKFLEYLQDCLKRDKYGIQSYNFEFHNSKVMYYYDKYMRSICKYSVNDTYIELYDRIIDELRKDNFIHEKLKVRTDINVKHDHRDDERLGDLSHLATGNNFLYYVYDCFKRDNVKNGSNFVFGPWKDVISIIYKKFKRKIAYSPDETYIELYNRILDALREKHFITEKLKVTKNNYKEYTFKTDKVNINNTDKFNDYFLGNKTMDLFEDYWYCMLQDEDQAYVENNNIHWDDIYLDYDGKSTVYINDNNTGDEILISKQGSAYKFIWAYDAILGYFEIKNQNHK